MAAPPPKLFPKSHKWACTQAKIIATTLSPRRGNLSCPRSSLQFCLGISWKSSFYNSCRLVSGHQNLHRKGTSVPKTYSFSCNIDMTAGVSSRTVHWQTKQLLILTWGVVTQSGVIWVVEAGFWARTRDTREHFRFSLQTHVSNFTLAPPNSP